MTCQKDITIQEGNDYYKVWTITLQNANCSTSVVNISGDTFSAQVINNFLERKILAEFDFTITNATSGQVSMSIPASATLLSCHCSCVNPDTNKYPIGFYAVDWHSATTLLNKRIVEGAVNFDRNPNIGGS